MRTRNFVHGMVKVVELCCSNYGSLSSIFLRRLHLIVLLFVLLLTITLLDSIPAKAALSDQPATTKTVVAGPYTVVLGLSTGQPIVDQDMTMTVEPREGITLTGSLLAQPGAGTDGVVVRRTLVADTVHLHMLEGVIRMPVRGAWTLIVNLNGLRGVGSVSIDTIVAAPNAIPPWQGWTIGLLPLVGFAWLIWRQLVYRRTLLKQAYQK